MKKIWKGVKQKMKDKAEACKDLLNSKQHRLILGLVLVGLGGGLIASAYMTVE